MKIYVLSAEILALAYLTLPYYVEQCESQFAKDETRRANVYNDSIIMNLRMLHLRSV